MIKICNLKNRISGLIIICVLGLFASHTDAYAQLSSKEVTMSVGETKTLYLPSSVTSKDLKSVTFYSNGISYVQVMSYTSYSVTVKAVKAFSSPIIIRCDYRYYVRSGSFTYEAAGAYDYRITVVGTGSGGSGVEPESIRFSSSVKAIDVGESVQLTPTILPADAEYTLTWSINDNSVATISQTGVLTGKSVGAADLKVKADNGVYAMLRVVVSEPKPTSVLISPSSITLNEGDNRYLTATVYPLNANQSVSWSSSNASVVSISTSGRITAVKAGTATVTAKACNGKVGTCTVVCNAAIPDIILSDKDGVSELPTKANVNYERMLYSGWNSMCVPFAISKEMISAFCENCKIVIVEELEVIGDERVLSVSEVQSVNAGEPCLIYVPLDVLFKFNLNGVALSPMPDNAGEMRGTYERTAVGPNCYKLTSDGSSFGVTRSADAIVAPFRSYLQFAETLETIFPEQLMKVKVKQVK